MKLEQQVISLDLAKRLKALGVKQESYFHYVNVKQGGKIHLLVKAADFRHPDSFYAAFTIAELGEILPKTFYHEGHLRCLVITNGLPTLPIWQVYYDIPACEPDHVIGREHANEAEARGLMIEYLITNNLLSV